MSCDNACIKNYVKHDYNVKAITMATSHRDNQPVSLSASRRIQCPGLHLDSDLF